MPKIARLALPALAAVAVAAAQASATVVVADADTYVRGGTESGTNYGGAERLRAERSDGAQPQRRFRATFVRFDASGLAGGPGSISDAILELTQISGGSQRVEVFGLADGLDGWDEASLDYDEAVATARLDPGNLTSLGLIDLAAGGVGAVLSLQSFALDAFLNAAGPDGLVTFVVLSAQPGNANGAFFASRENPGFDGPTLQAAFTPVPVPAASFLFAPFALGLLRRSRVR